MSIACVAAAVYIHGGWQIVHLCHDAKTPIQSTGIKKRVETDIKKKVINHINFNTAFFFQSLSKIIKIIQEDAYKLWCIA
jgi:hypothetical protein